MRLIVKTLLVNIFLLVFGCLCARSAAVGRMYSDPIFTSDTYEGLNRDKEGYLWIATGSGLLRFDGYKYRLYRHDDSDETTLSDSRMHAVFVDSKGRVWASTSNGLNLYDPSTDSFKRISLPAMDYAGYIMDVAEQNDGTITFNVAGMGVYIIDDSKGRLDAVRFIPKGHDEYERLCVLGNLVYISTAAGDVVMLKPNGSTEHIPVTDGYISSLMVERDGTILVSSVNEVFRIHPAEGNRVERIKVPSDTKMIIKNFSRASNGNVYFSTAGNGVWKILPGAGEVTPCPTIYLPHIKIDQANLGAIYCDDEGNIWLGCQYQGLTCVPFHPSAFEYLLISDLFPNFRGGIDGFAVSGNDVILGFSNNLGVISQDGIKVSESRLDAKGSISCIRPTGRDRLLLGVLYDGVWSSDRSGRAARRIIDQPGKYSSIKLTELPDGGLLVGYHGLGLARYGADLKPQWYKHEAGSGLLSNPFFASMEITPDSTGVWIGLYGGISYLDLTTNTFEFIEQTPFLQGATYTLLPLADGSLLAGTSHGLVHLSRKGDVLRKLTTADGLSDNDIRSIVEDRKGGFWIGTKRGLNYLAGVNATPQGFHGGNGMIESSFPWGGRLESGKLVFGSNLGITYFNPDSLLGAEFNGRVYATSIILNGRPINPSTRIDGRQVMTGVSPMKLSLPYTDNTLTVNLSTLDFRDGSNLRYLWRLDGLSKEWNSTQPGENTLYLPHLDPGKYKLRFKAVDNQEESEESVIEISISTPWYMSSLAMVVYGVIFVALIILSLVVLKKKREEEINETKIRYFMDISHDIRSPITLILTPLESLLSEPLPAAVKHKLHTMHRNGQRILSLVNQLLDLRKIDKGGMPLHCTPTDLPKFIAELVKMFVPQASDKNLSLKFDNPGEPAEKVWIDRDNLDKILVNLISNAIKYTPSGGSVEVALKVVDDDNLGKCAQVSVTDTGIGLGNVPPEQLFERFYRASSEMSRGVSGVGIGLDLCRQLTTLHHGTIKGDNRSDGVRGSVFTILLPLDETAYSATELFDDRLTATDSDSERHAGAEGMTSLNADSSEKIKRKRLATPRRILVVDDDSEIRDYVSRHLEEEGYKTLVAADGQEALKIVAEGGVDLIVSDVKMPVMDGLTLLRRLRSNVDTLHVPVIILSSKNEIADRIEGWGSGADGYLAKPFNIGELDTMISTIIEKRQMLRGKFSGAQSGTDIPSDAPDVKGFNEVLMEKIMKVINDRIDNPDLNVEMLGNSVGISRVQLYRKMKDMIGMTPSDFIRNIRLKRACQLLRKPDLDVTQVAYAVGFSAQPHFSTAFKRFTGYSPTEYKQRVMRGEDLPLPDDLPGPPPPTDA